MSILDQLESGSYEGATFLIRNSSLTAGRKTTTHEYPNSSRRYVEDLGGLQDTYTIEAIISEPNYFQKRDALINALNKNGTGQLSHPFYGNVTVTAKPFTISEDIRSLNIATFTMVFEKSDTKATPTQSSSKVSIINQYRSTLFGLTARDLTNTFNVDRTSPQNYIDALTTLSNITSAFSVNSDTVVRVNDEINEFNSVVDTFDSHKNTNVFDSTQLATDLNNVFVSYGQLGSSPSNQFELTRRLFSFGADREAILPTTAKRIRRIANRNILNSVMRANSLVQAYNTVTSLSLGNTEEIDELSKTLDSQFDFLMANNTLQGDTVAEIKNMRVEVREYLDQQRALAPKIATISTQEIPMTILSYNYYGNTDNTENLIDLNNELNVTFVKGDVRILTQ